VVFLFLWSIIHPYLVLDHQLSSESILKSLNVLLGTTGQDPPAFDTFLVLQWLRMELSQTFAGLKSLSVIARTYTQGLLCSKDLRHGCLHQIMLPKPIS